MEGFGPFNNHFGNLSLIWSSGKVSHQLVFREEAIKILWLIGVDGSAVVLCCWILKKQVAAS